jgi:hypothetical protein
MNQSPTQFTDRVMINPHRMILSGLQKLVLLCSLVLSLSPIAAQIPSSHPIGSNLDAIDDYSPQLPFIDLFLSSREWFTQCTVDQDPGCTPANGWNTGESHLLDLDSSGWVRSLPSRASAPIFTAVATFWDIPPEFPKGRFIVRFEGAGSLEYGLGARRIERESTPGRDIITVDLANGGILMRIVATDPHRSGDYLRNIRLMREEDEKRFISARFSPQFLRQIRPYQVLRFMDWMRTNNTPTSSWHGRSLPSDARYSTEKGVPVEVMLELANATKKAPWFTLPHRFELTDARSFATLVHSKLHDALPVYVEYSNEIWNDLFSQGSWMEQEGERKWPGGAESGFTKRINFYGSRAAEICDIWRNVFADDPSRVQCVIASQAANSWTASEALSCPLWNERPCAAHGIRSLAIAPYFGGYLGHTEYAASVEPWTSHSDGGIAALFSELRRGSFISGGPLGGAMSQSLNWVEENKGVADTHGVSLISYEGGQHLVGVGAVAESATITSLFTAANRHPDMGTLYDTYLAGWNARGGGLFMHFTDIGSYSKFGSWGALEAIGQTSSPKYDALTRFTLGKTSSRSKVTLTVRLTGRGSVVSLPTSISCGRRCRTSVIRGQVLRLTARPARRFQLKSWSGACRHTRPRCIVRMSRSMRARATFIQTR